MEIAIIIVFVLGYAAIALEHPLHVDKAASALLLGIVCWTIFVLSVHGNITEFVHDGITEFLGHKPIIDDGDTLHAFLESRFMYHLSEIASILFFLMGAMTIVETVDSHGGFSIITDRITTTNKVKLLWIVCLITFFLSAVLDNLTTTIVMISLLRKLVKDRETRWFFVGFVVIAANAGGAFSPIGDVTTTMLWIKKQIPDVQNIVEHVFLPAIATLAIPLGIMSFTLKGNLDRVQIEGYGKDEDLASKREKNIVFILGIGGLLFVPVFKTITHLPPFMGMMFSLGILWVVTEMMHKRKEPKIKRELSILGTLRKIDMPSVLFFMGILLGVSALQEVGILHDAATFLDEKIGNIYAINFSIGLLSSIVDNVPLVAAAQGMYEIQPTGVFAQDGIFWLFLAYCAGTGGSVLIIGSAAGVAAMGLERIDFIWYFKKLTWLALIGYVAGAIIFILTNPTP